MCNPASAMPLGVSGTWLLEPLGTRTPEPDVPPVRCSARWPNFDAFFEYAAKYDLAVWAYCLMRNHVHFIVVPHRRTSLARVFGRTHADYARYANIVRRGCGHLREWLAQSRLAFRIT